MRRRDEMVDSVCMTCGKHRRVSRRHEVGNCRSCSRTRHGQCVRSIRRATEWRSWMAMKERCLNSNNPSYKNYGGRGIAVCERWLAFDTFFADMGRRPPGTSLDRIDVNYEPNNCRWATTKEQGRNKRVTKLTADLVRELRSLHFGGIGPAELARRFGIKPSYASNVIARKVWKDVRP